MKSLYKYSSYRKGYFDNPVLRITQRYALNDPFESLPPAEQVESFIQSRLNSEIVLDSQNHISFTGDFDAYGVVSLSQTFDNLLMWSHYGDQHSGFVIELDHQKIGLKNRVLHSSYLSDDNGLAKPVIYSNNRSVNCYEVSHKDAIFMKSEQWMYEKEYRIAERLMFADQIKIRNSAIEDFDRFINTSEPYFNFIKDCDNYSVFEINDNHPTWLNCKSETDLNNLKKHFLMNACNKLSKLSDSLFLYQIPKEAITKIILGCNMSSENEQEIITSLKNYGYSIELLKAQQHPNRFELDMVPMKI